MTHTTVQARARQVGKGIRLRQMQLVDALARDPVTLSLQDGGSCVLFRFGVVVFFDVAPIDEIGFIDKLAPYIVEPNATEEAEVLTIRIMAGVEERIEDDGLLLADWDTPRMQLVAEALARSELLDNYEVNIARTVDRIEPLAEQMKQQARIPRQARSLLVHIGEVLHIQHSMVGRAQVGDKPDLLWENPQLVRLWQRLEHEYDLEDRQVALDRKLELVNSTASTLLEMLQTRRSLRVEWYIVVLIVVEILLTLYDLFFSGH